MSIEHFLSDPDFITIKTLENHLIDYLILQETYLDVTTDIEDIGLKQRLVEVSSLHAANAEDLSVDLKTLERLLGERTIGKIESLIENAKYDADTELVDLYESDAIDICAKTGASLPDWLTASQPSG